VTMAVMFSNDIDLGGLVYWTEFG